MMIDERQSRILYALREEPDITVKELAARLYVSEPTVRRDLTELARRGLLEKRYGGARLCEGAADQEIPFLLREQERSRGKVDMGRQAAAMVQDGMVIMLDGSTSAYHLVPYLASLRDLIVVTSGAKTAVALAEKNIRTFCTGGQMLIHSFSYVGEAAEAFVRQFNADMCFFSCHGLSDDGMMTDRAIEEVNLRRAMFHQCRQRVLLCDATKFGKTCFYNMGHVRELDAILSDAPLPPGIAACLSPA